MSTEQSISAVLPAPLRTWSLRVVLVISMLLFSLLPATVVGWLWYRNNLQTITLLAEKIVDDIAQKVQVEAETHLSLAHTVLNGLTHERATESTLLRARQLIQEPELFEKTAFSMTRMTPNVKNLYLGTYKGEFFGVEAPEQADATAMTVAVRHQGGEGRHYYAAELPGDRSHETKVDAAPYAPRSRPWYQLAVERKGRAFTPIHTAPVTNHLLITLAQPVYDSEGGVLGVFALDLHLQRLNEVLQTMRISAHGAAFLVDESGFLVASSTGDPLVSEVNGKIARNRPQASKNAILRSAFQEVAPSLGKTLESSVQRQAFTRRVPLGDDALMVVLKPFGESQGLRWSLVIAAPESDFAGTTQAALHRTLAIMGLVLVLGTLLATWLAYRLSRRIKLLTLAAAQMARAEVPRMQLRTRITEVRQLSQAVHDSAVELQRNRAAIEAHTLELENANQTLEERVVSRTAELTASREEALGAARAKAAFLATMSHEIRTPLNGVVGMTTLLADTPLNSEQNDYVHTMRVSSDLLLGVINDILDFSKIESGKLELENEPFNLLGAIEEACDIGAPRAREKGLELLVDIGDDLPAWVRGDVTRLRQVLLNLVNNAVKFTERGQVIVSAHIRESFTPDQGALLEFCVKDTGIGIPLDRQSALFESFAQVDASTTRKYGGTGLGLAICKRLVKLMDGNVGLVSAPAKGSTFWFTARLGFTDAPEVSMLSSLHLISLAGKQVAVVDDTVLNLRILDKQLRRWGMQPTLFERAADALNWLQDHTVDIVVSDMHMPDMDGQTFAETLRQRSPATPIVLLTSGTMPTGEVARVFDARLLKPYRQSQLFEAIARLTSGEKAFKNVVKAVTVAPRNQLILVVDDNAVNLKVALAMLAKLGYEAATAIHGREAVDRVAASLRTGIGETPRRYAAILMDANMPVMDGFEASRLLIATYGKAVPPIIALTASVLEEDRQRCLQAGMIGFLPKPLRIDELSEALARYGVNPEQQKQAQALAESPSSSVPATAGGDSEPLLMDWSRLEEFKEFDDEEGTMTREVLALFTRETPQRIDDIREALAASDSAALSRTAHAVKGAASNVGAQALSDACGALEQACRQGQWPINAGLQVAQIVELAAKTRQALNDWATING